MSTKLFVSFLLLVTVALGLHEDEVGQRDWYKQHIGIANAAVFHMNQGTKQVYVSSEQGAFGALSTTKPEIRWRHVLSPNETIVCWAPHDEAVAAISSKGNVFIIIPTTGTLVQTRQLTSVSTPHLKVHSCAADNKKGFVALLTSDVAAMESEIVTLGPNDQLTSNGKLSLPASIRKAAVDVTATHVYAILDGGSLAYSKTETNALATLTGIAVAGCTSLDIAPSSGAALIRISGGEAVLIAPNGKQSPVPTCASKTKCKYSLVEEEIVRVAREDENTVRVTLGSGFDATVPIAGRYAPSVLASHQTVGKQSTRLYLLLKDCHATLRLAVIAKDSMTGVVQWTRYEGLSSPAFIKIADHEMAGTSPANDWAGTDHHIFVLSTTGMLYHDYTQPSRANETTPIADIAGAIADAAGATCIHGQVAFKRMTVDSGAVIVTASYAGDAYVVELKTSGEIVSTNKIPQVDNFLGHMIVGKNKKVHVHPHERDIPTAGSYGVNLQRLSNQNMISGVRVNNNDEIVDTWSLTFPGKVMAHATAQSHLSVFSTEHLRVFANETSKVGEVRRKYPTANLLVVAHIEMQDLDDDGTESPVLVISFVDMVTGSVLATNRHADGAGPVHIVVVEHAVITHFYNTERHKYLVDVSELFEAEDTLTNDAAMASPASVVTSFFIKPRVISSFSMRPPQVASQVLQFPPGAISSLGTTVSFQGVARKLVVFGTVSGQVYAIDLRSFLFGGQKVPGKPDASPFTFVPTPSVATISHRNYVLQSKIVVVSPTNLESSNHVVVAGLDMMYCRVSAGKAWDLLNDDFNHHLLMTICGVLLLATLIARWVAAHRSLKLQWA